MTTDRQLQQRRADQALIDRVSGGGEDSAAAFETLYRNYRDWVVALAYRFTGDRDMSLDILQETFMYVMRRAPGLTLTGQLKTLLYPSVRHLAIEALRKAKRFRPYDEHTLDSLPAAPLEEQHREDGLAALLATLPPGHREVLILRFVDDLQLSEIAVALGVPLGTVKSRLHNALASLRNDPRTKDLLGP
ncbi:MAG: sigma-70 family RNA polymerase sigma factor [Planctomycetes bacterium]|nr:sigma-70 family RNA polymerase sigma factor [Planctomycetota bacterium]